MPPDGVPVLALRDLRKVFDGVTALDGVTLEVPPEGIFGLIGPNGAGKTTLFNVVSGILPASGGQVLLAGQPLTGLPAHRISALGVARTFQNLQTFTSLTVLENVLVGCHRHGQAGVVETLLRLPRARREERLLRDRAREALAFAGLSAQEQAMAASLPPGHQRLLEIARALAMAPRLLLLDEPAAGLTTREAEALGVLIGRLAERGLTAVLIDHDMSLVMGTCSQVAVLDRGRLLALDTPSAIQRNPAVIAAYLGEEAEPH